MKKQFNIKLDLEKDEKSQLRAGKFKVADLFELEKEEIADILQVSKARAKELHALICFQKIPSIGIRFAEDLIFLGYFWLNELKDKSGAELLNEYEAKKGFWTDPCVENQFRLVVDFARNSNKNKNWWDFTAERKAFRSQNGYPKTRPKMAWHEIKE